MNLLPTDIIPITQARGKLGDLTKRVSGKNYVILTKGGQPEAALVDVKYLAKLEKEVEKIYQKTFIDPQLLPLTREFTSQEIKDWQKEDRF